MGPPSSIPSGCHRGPGGHGLWRRQPTKLLRNSGGWPKGLVGLAQGTWYTMRAMRLFVRLWDYETVGTKRKRNGYPFTTFTDFSDFLGMSTGSLVRWSCYYVDLATNLIWLVVLVNSPVFLLISPANLLLFWDRVACNCSLYIHNLPWCYYNLHVFFFRGSSNRGITRSR